MNKNNYKIGLMGFGFINSALAHGFSLHADIKIYDKYNDFYDTLEYTVQDSDYIFIGVPTPMKEDGTQDLSNIHDAVSDVARVADERKIIIIRSTVLPGTTRACAEKYPEHDFLFIPEFLTERSAKLDFINASRIVIGGDEIPVTRTKALYRTRFKHTPIFETTWEGAETLKYMANCFFAIKISFLNEMYDIAEHIGVPYEDLEKMFLADCRIGNSHTDVPGHDGYRGYGGKCFKKDVSAFFNWAKDNGLSAKMCEAADEVNEKVRNVKDWLDIKGAVSSNDYGKEE